MKTCTKCHKEYSASAKYFHRDKMCKDGLYSHCKGCKSKSRKKYYEEHRQYENQTNRQYYSTIIGHLRSIFTSIKHRCNNFKCKSYKNYGGRGIKCLFTSDEFVNYIINILQIDPRGLEIDRINNNGHYEKGNIRFVTHSENNRNKRKK